MRTGAQAQRTMRWLVLGFCARSSYCAICRSFSPPCTTQLRSSMADSQGDDSAMSDDDTIKCLIMTDNHVGYLERDAVRGEDSFRALEEMLQIAQAEQANCAWRKTAGFLTRIAAGGLHSALRRPVPPQQADAQNAASHV